MCSTFVPFDSPLGMVYLRDTQLPFGKEFGRPTDAGPR